MNGIHDLGGKEGFGPIHPLTSEPVFHEPWESSVFAAVMASMAQGLFTIDEFRHAIERMGNQHYLQSSYYEHWLEALQDLLLRKGLVDAQALELRTQAILEAQENAEPLEPVGDDQLAPALAQGIGVGLSSHREVDVPARFKPGDGARTLNLNPRTHTRLPAYARDKPCRIQLYHGAHVLPDSNAHELGEQPEHLYTVCFESADLWGQNSDRVRGKHYLDVWESYLASP